MVCPSRVFPPFPFDLNDMTDEFLAMFLLEWKYDNRLVVTLYTQCFHWMMLKRFFVNESLLTTDLNFFFSSDEAWKTLSFFTLLHWIVHFPAGDPLILNAFIDDDFAMIYFDLDLHPVILMMFFVIGKFVFFLCFLLFWTLISTKDFLRSLFYNFYACSLIWFRLWMPTCNFLHHEMSSMMCMSYFAPNFSRWNWWNVACCMFPTFFLMHFDVQNFLLLFFFTLHVWKPISWAPIVHPLMSRNEGILVGPFVLHFYFEEKCQGDL